MRWPIPAGSDDAGRGPVLVALAIIAAVTTADIVAANTISLVGLMISASLLCGLTTSPRATAAVGGLTVALAAAAFLWDDSLSSWRYWVPLTVNVLGALFAVTMAMLRQRLRDEARDNTVLSRDLSRVERQLDTILATVDAAIMVRDVHGRMVFANQAAADLLKLPDVEALMAEPAVALMERFDVYSEAGEPVGLDELPGSRVLAGEPAPAAVVVRNVVRDTGEERWLLNRATAVVDERDGVLMAVNLIEDITETKRSEIAGRLLAETARRVAQADDLEGTLQAIADAAVPGLADWAGVDLLEPGNRIAAVAIAHRDPEKVRLGWHLRKTWPVDPRAPDGLPQVIRDGVSQLMPDVTDEMLVAGAQDPEHLEALRGIGLTSTMIVPIVAGSRVLGALSFVSSTTRRFDERDLELACDLGRQAGVFISNAELHSEQAHIARTLQAGLVPMALPAIDGWQVSTAYRAAGRANDVGGDFYDVVPFSGGWAAIIGDVVGKGAEAAALTALARHTLAAIIESTGDPGQALRVLNRRLRERANDARSLCTIAIVSGNSASGRIAIHSAGHPLPMLLRGGIAQPVGATSPLLGFVDDLEVAEATVDLAEGEQLLLYTDGVLDAVGAEDRFGERRLLAAAGSLDPESGAGELLAVVERFAVGDQRDDIAIVTLTRTAAASPPLRSLG